MAVGLKQKSFVKEIVNKVFLSFVKEIGVFYYISHVMFSDLQFLAQDFDVMLFHYDDVVDEWGDMEWSNTVIHVSATNQTKWYVCLI